MDSEKFVRPGKAIRRVPKKFVERVMQRVEISASGCWLWKGCAPDGYAQMKWKGKAVRVHRWMCATRETVRAGEDVHHKCGVTKCVNPEHLTTVEHDQHPVNGDNHVPF